MLVSHTIPFCLKIFKRIRITDFARIEEIQGGEIDAETGLVILQYYLVGKGDIFTQWRSLPDLQGLPY